MGEANPFGEGTARSEHDDSDRAHEHAYFALTKYCRGDTLQAWRCGPPCDETTGMEQVGVHVPQVCAAWPKVRTSVPCPSLVRHCFVLSSRCVGTPLYRQVAQAERSFSTVRWLKKRIVSASNFFWYRAVYALSEQSRGATLEVLVQS